MATKSLTIELPASEAVKMGAAIDGYLAKIDRALEQSKREHAEIKRLKARTRSKLAALNTLL